MKQQNSGHDEPARLAFALGWFSIGLGLAELSAPRSVARLIGVLPDDETVSVMRTYGAREIANGIAILSEPDRPAWLWSRVAGDALDLSSIACVNGSKVTSRGRAAGAAAAVLGVTALDLLSARQLSRRNRVEGRSARRHVRVVQAITINRPLEEVYAFWRNFENFPRFMRHIESVQITGGSRSHWRATGPAGTRFEWDAEMIEERPNERIAWRSLPSSDVGHSGSVAFLPAPGARGTEVHVDMEYGPPAGRLGRTVAMLFGEEPEQQIKDDLRRVKQLLETGEITVSDGPGLWRPAQPAAEPGEIRTLAGVRA